MAYLRLRQICLVAPTLEPAVADLADILGLAVCYRDGNVAKYGLVNALLPVGRCFLEVVAPTRDGTAAGRYLERRQGAGGYMVIIDCDDIAQRRRHVETLGVRIANPLCYKTYTGLQLHPRDTGGAMLEINHTEGGESLEGPYHPAGPHWTGAIRTDVTIGWRAAVLQSAEPLRLAERWARILERPLTTGTGGSLEIKLDLGALRFVPLADGRGEGLAGIDLDVAAAPRILSQAERRGCARSGNEIAVCGMRFSLSAPS
jgi:hypothetical protein